MTSNQPGGLPLEQYIAEAFVKCSNIILGSRIFQTEQQRLAQDRRSGRWVSAASPQTADRLCGDPAILGRVPKAVLGISAI